MVKYNFQQTQYQFAAHIRNPQLTPRPADIEGRRMKIYNDLFYNNVEGFMSDSFPVLRTIISDENWHSLIRRYFHNHKAKTPLFPEMPREFLYFLENEYRPAENDFPFMLELAHYEWAELALSLLDQTLPEPDTGLDDIANVIPILSPLAWILSYQYPVHQIGPDFLPDTSGEQPTWLLLYRDREDEVHFMELNPVTARLLQLVQAKQALTSQSLLEQIVQELNHPTPDSVITGGLQIMQDLFARQVLLPAHLEDTKAPAE